VNAAVAAGSAAIRLRSRSRVSSIVGADELAGGAAGGTFGVQGGLQQDGRCGGVHHLPPGAGVLAAAAQRAVRLGGGEALVDQPDRDRRPARSAANSLAPAAAGPSRPDSDVGSPTMTSIAPSLAASPASSARASAAFVPGPDASTVSGEARMPPGSLRATPTRTEPTSTASRTPCLNGS